MTFRRLAPVAAISPFARPARPNAPTASRGVDALLEPLACFVPPVGAAERCAEIDEGARVLEPSFRSCENSSTASRSRTTARVAGLDEASMRREAPMASGHPTVERARAPPRRGRALPRSGREVEGPLRPSCARARRLDCRRGRAERSRRPGAAPRLPAPGFRSRCAGGRGRAETSMGWTWSTGSCSGKSPWSITRAASSASPCSRSACARKPTLYGQAMSMPCATQRSSASRRSATAARRSPRRVWLKPRHTKMNATLRMSPRRRACATAWSRMETRLVEQPSRASTITA